MNHIEFTKNGFPFLIFTHLIILFIVCMPMCSTGIVKREIDSSNSTKLIWDPKKVSNNASAIDVTTTTAATKLILSTPLPKITIRSRGSTPKPSTTLTPSTPSSIPTTTATASTSTTTETTSTSTSTSTSTTTTENITTKISEKYAENISNENATVASMIDEQPINDKNNLDDDAESINFSYGDGPTTEEQHFDLSRYTSDYNGHDREQNDYKETHQKLANENESEEIETLSPYNVDYNLREMVLTTPETLYFDEKHKEYNNGKSFERYRDENDRFNYTAPKPGAKEFNADAFLNDIRANSSEERKQSTYSNESEIESSNYDVSAIEIKDRTEKNNSVTGVKKAKFMQDGSHVNLTIPDAAEVWALASMKNVEHTKNSQGKFYNVTTLQKEPDNLENGTLVTKQLADWVEVMKNNDFTNTTFETENYADNLLRGNIKFEPKPLAISDQDSASQENQIIAVRMTTLPPPIVVTRNYTRTTKPMISMLSKSNDSENKINIQQISETSPSAAENFTDDDRETTTAENEVRHDNIDNSQNELKTKFSTISEPTTTEMEFQSTTDSGTTDSGTTDNGTTDKATTDKATTDKGTSDKGTSDKGTSDKGTSDKGTTDKGATDKGTTDKGTTEFVESVSETFMSNDKPTTTEIIETTTGVTNKPDDNNVRTTTENELIPTTNNVNFETESITEIVDDDSDHTTSETSSVTTSKSPITTEKDLLHTQSTTLVPQYVEIERTSEMKIPTTEFTQKTLEYQPTTEFITQMETKTPTVFSDSDIREELTTNIINLNRDEYRYSTIKTNQNRIQESTTQGHFPDAMPEVIEEIPQHPSTTEIPDIGGYSIDEPDTNAAIAISISVAGVVVVAVVLGVLFVMRKRQKQLSYGQRCRPVGMDAYSLDNISVYNSVRRKGVLRMSKRSYGNAAFDDPGLKNNLLTGISLVAFAQKRSDIYEEFKELPSVTARAEEVPAGCEDKNRYANIIPLPESRVFLKRIGDDEKTEYINANYVKGPKDHSHYYIACQGPLESTVNDFWRMIWEQNSRVIIMATDLIENGIEQCAEYLPPSFVIDSHVTFGDFHITLKHRDVKDKYAMSMVHVKNMNTNTWREITHFWYQWPDTGVPTEQSSLINLLLEARGYLKVNSPEQMDKNENNHNNNSNLTGGVDKSKSLLRSQGPLTVHCSPGTGRTGTIISCDIALRALDMSKSVDIPQIVYFVRTGRASAVRTREQYEFIYKVASMYAAKITGPITEN